MTVHAKLARVLNRLATGSSVARVRYDDQVRAERNGAERNRQLEVAVDRLEEAADALWKALG